MTFCMLGFSLFFILTIFMDVSNGMDTDEADQGLIKVCEKWGKNVHGN